jgi:hypothetical protein
VKQKAKDSLVAAHRSQLIRSVDLHAAAKSIKAMSKSERVDILKPILKRFGINSNGFRSQKGGGRKLYQKRQSKIIDIGVKNNALLPLIKKLSNKKSSKVVSNKLSQVKNIFPDQTRLNLVLVLITSWREGTSHVTTQKTKLIHTYWDDAGLDFLWKQRNKLGLPSSVLRKWKKRPSFINPETGKRVFPGAIPAKDLVLAYAATNRYKFKIFEFHVKKILGKKAGNATLKKLKPDARMFWTAFAFLRPGGAPFGKAKGQGFGAKAAVGYLAAKAKNKGRDLDLNDILTERYLHRYGAIRNAKARAVEAVYLESFL